MTAVTYLARLPDETLGMGNNNASSFIVKTAFAAFAVVAVGATVGLAGAQESKPAGASRDQNFEASQGKVPPRWGVTTKGYETRPVTRGAGEGKYAIELRANGDDNPAGFGNLMTGFLTNKTRGKTIEISALLKSDGRARAQMWARVDRQDDAMGFFDNMNDRPVLSTKWTRVSLRFRVDDDAVGLFYGVLTPDHGSIFVDDFKFRILD